MPPLTPSELKSVMPRCTAPEAWLRPLDAAMSQFDINDGRRAAAFLAQIALESAELSHLVEDPNYSAARLMKVWPQRFPALILG